MKSSTASPISPEKFNQRSYVVLVVASTATATVVLGAEALHEIFLLLFSFDIPINTVSDAVVAGTRKAHEGEEDPDGEPQGAEGVDADEEYARKVGKLSINSATPR